MVKAQVVRYIAVDNKSIRNTQIMVVLSTIQENHFTTQKWHIVEHISDFN